jgi:hypothetical protein
LGFPDYDHRFDDALPKFLTALTAGVRGIIEPLQRRAEHLQYSENRFRRRAA